MKEILFVLPIISGAAGAGMVAKFGPKLGFVDVPSSRSSHIVSTPKGGGIGILITFVIACIYLDISWFFWLPGLLIALSGFVGDRIEISPKIRLVCQFLLTGILLFNQDLKIFVPLHLNADSFAMQIAGFLGFFVIFSVFIVGTANFYNFMDGINGIAGITAVIAFSLLAYNASSKGRPELAVLSVCIALACLGFLPWNMPHAKVFMGDVGSILLGFVFSALVVQISENLTDLVCYAGFLVPFYFDELSTMVERLRGGESLLSPHRRHLYQVLVNQGMISHWKVSMGFGFMQMLISFSLLWIKSYGLLAEFTTILLFFTVFIIISSRFKHALTKSLPG